MTGKDMVLLVSTFLMGMFAGGYFYVTAFAPSYERGVNGVQHIDKDALVIEGEMYGSCEASGVCASFMLVDGRSYSYAPYRDAVVVSGKMAPGIRVQTLQVLDDQTLHENSTPVTARSCASERGGVDYRYTVTKHGVPYELDTCTTLFAGNGNLQQKMLDIWFFMENPDAPAPKIDAPVSVPNPFDVLWERFHQGGQ